MSTANIPQPTSTPSTDEAMVRGQAVGEVPGGVGQGSVSEVVAGGGGAEVMQAQQQERVGEVDQAEHGEHAQHPPEPGRQDWLRRPPSCRFCRSGREEPGRGSVTAPTSRTLPAAGITAIQNSGRNWWSSSSYPPDGAGVDGIVAAGDVARWPNPHPHPRLAAPARRVEHWINAIEMGQAAADALLAGPSRAQPFAPVPRFWSEQHGVRIQAVGTPALGDTLTLLDGTLESRRFIAGYTSQPDPRHPPVLHGAVAFDSPRGLLAYRDLVGLPLHTKATIPA